MHCFNLLDSVALVCKQNNIHDPLARHPFAVHAFNSWRATGQCWLAIALLRPTTSGTLARCFRSVSPVWRMRLLSVRFILVSCSALPASHAAELHLDVWHHLQEEQCIAPGTTFFTGANACVEGCLRDLATICRRLSFQGSNKIMARDCSEVHSCSRFPTPHTTQWIPIYNVFFYNPHQYHHNIDYRQDFLGFPRLTQLQGLSPITFIGLDLRCRWTPISQLQGFTPWTATRQGQTAHGKAQVITPGAVGKKIWKHISKYLRNNSWWQFQLKKKHGQHFGESPGCGCILGQIFRVVCWGFSSIWMNKHNGPVVGFTHSRLESHSRKWQHQEWKPPVPSCALAPWSNFLHLIWMEKYPRQVFPNPSARNWIETPTELFLLICIGAEYHPTTNCNYRPQSVVYWIVLNWFVFGYRSLVEFDGRSL